jgi:hypothetical protein
MVFCGHFLGKFKDVDRFMGLEIFEVFMILFGDFREGLDDLSVGWKFRRIESLEEWKIFELRLILMENNRT